MLKITLKAARINANLTRVQAAERLGISVDTLKNYENGSTMPRFDIVTQMEELYEIPAEYFKIF